MPPKVKITKEDIIDAAVGIVRKDGVGAIGARTLATALGCSTQPIFSNFTSMEELESKTLGAAYELYLDFIKSELDSGKYPPYKAFGMAYVRFAKDEKELFKLLFMRDRTDEDLSPKSDFERSIDIIMNSNGVSYDTAKLMHLEMWATVHGIGVMLATSFLPLGEELISDMLTDVYQGIRARHIAKENDNGSN